jgi:hypothetical protein
MAGAIFLGAAKDLPKTPGQPTGHSIARIGG